MASLVIFIFLLMHVCWMLDKIETGDEDDEEESEDSYSEINGDLVLSKITEMRLVPSDAGKCILAVMHALYCFHWLQHFYVSSMHY